MSDSQSNLDIRWPIGLLFAAMGALLTVYGFFTSARSILWTYRINLNLCWGVVMLLFGLAMIWGAIRADRNP